MRVKQRENRWRKKKKKKKRKKEKSERSGGRKKKEEYFGCMYIHTYRGIGSIRFEF